MAKKNAISATVTGDDEEVGFRALVMKQAIAHNLAGSAVNEPDQRVLFTLQGNEKGIAAALGVIDDGTPRSNGLTVKTEPTPVEAGLDTFTIVGWTSSRRKITTPYTLVFQLRAHDGEISDKDAEKVWRQILEHTLDAEDRQKLHSEE